MEKERARGRVSENRKKNPKGKEQRKENLNFLGVLGRAQEKKEEKGFGTWSLEQQKNVFGSLGEGQQGKKKETKSRFESGKKAKRETDNT